MEAVISWRVIGGWVIELGGEAVPVPILDLTQPEELQWRLRKWWQDCRVTYDKRGWAELVIRNIERIDGEALLHYLQRTYQSHPVTGETIVWSIGQPIG